MLINTVIRRVWDLTVLRVGRAEGTGLLTRLQGSPASVAWASEQALESSMFVFGKIV